MKIKGMERLRILWLLDASPSQSRLSRREDIKIVEVSNIERLLISIPSQREALLEVMKREDCNSVIGIVCLDTLDLLTRNGFRPIVHDVETCNYHLVLRVKIIKMSLDDNYD